MNTLAALLTWMSILVYGVTEEPPPPADVHAVSNAVEGPPPEPAPKPLKAETDRIYVGF